METSQRKSAVTSSAEDLTAPRMFSIYILYVSYFSGGRHIYNIHRLFNFNLIRPVMQFQSKNPIPWWLLRHEVGRKVHLNAKINSYRSIWPLYFQGQNNILFLSWQASIYWKDKLWTGKRQPPWTCHLQRKKEFVTFVNCRRTTDRWRGRIENSFEG